MSVSSHLPLPEGPDMKPVLGMGLEGLRLRGHHPNSWGGPRGLDKRQVLTLQKLRAAPFAGTVMGAKLK